MGIPLRTAVETRRLALLARVPFFGILLGYLRLVEQPAAWFTERGLCATACTDGERIVYCSEWFEDLLRTDPEMILTVLAHEVLHSARFPTCGAEGHATRCCGTSRHRGLDPRDHAMHGSADG
jgi:hypothetical protein